MKRVADGRQLDAPGVDAVGRGRVWTGAQAAERGLVDELGGLHEAVVRAKASSSSTRTPTSRSCRIRRRARSPSRSARCSGGAARAAAERPLAAWLRPVEPWLGSPRGRESLALLPFSIEIR